MKQTTKRVLSVVLSVLMLISAMSVFTFAENNYKPDEEYYNRIISDAVIVNPEWKNMSDGDTVSYNYRGKTITETFDSNIHFSSLSAAYGYCVDMNVKNPVIVLCSGIIRDKVTIVDSVTFIGANAGINPNVVSSDPLTPWSVNPDRGAETFLRGCIDVAKKVNSNIEVVFDGVTLTSGFAYVDAGNKNAVSSAVLRNSVVSGISSVAYGATTTTSAFFFGSAVTSINNVKIENVRCVGLKSTGVVGSNLTNLEVSGLYFMGNMAPFAQLADAPVDQNPNYVIKDSMFYNNSSAGGVLSFDHSAKDSNQRSDTYLEISGCVFADDPSVTPDETKLDTSPILYTVVSSKNRINMHDNMFVGAADYSAPVVDYLYTTVATTTGFGDNINVYSNKFIGYYNLNDTYGLTADTTLSYVGNYFADHTGVQHDPVYPSDSSKKNIVIDYFWLNSEMTIPSNIFNINSTGIPNSKIDHINKTIQASVDFGVKIPVNIVANDSSTEYTLYDRSMSQVITEIDSANLVSGDGKNTFYAVGKSSKTNKECVYTLVLTTYNPALSAEFDLKDTYMLAPEVKDLPAGADYYKTWEGMAYRFTVGVNVFASAPEIIAACDNIPTIIIPAGVFSEQIVVTGSAVILGAKHGVNPNIPQFDEPDNEWKQNPNRSFEDQETILEGAIGTVYDSSEATLVVDGFTFGPGSGLVDRGEGLDIYATTIIKNVIVDGANESVFTGGKAPDRLATVFSFGGASDTYKNNHKDVRLVNIRMNAQGNAVLLGDYFESLVMDGVYVANNNAKLGKSEWTHPAGQNFYMEIRNSCFYKNNTGEYYFIVNNNSADSKDVKSNRIVLENNTFYNTSTNQNGIFGIRFCGDKDSIRFVGNTFITATAGSVIPGSENWWLGASQCHPNKVDISKLTPEQYAAIECINDVVIKYNHFVKCTTIVDMSAAKEGTVWDWNYNYFAPSYSKSTAGVAVTSRSGYDRFKISDYYFTDWDMTTLNVENKDDCKDEQFKKELKYSINGPGVVDTSAKTYIDNVSANTSTYDFGVKLETRQASYGIYSDAACTNKIDSPVSIAGGENVFYLKMASFDGTVCDIYKAVITKPFGNEANITRCGSWRVSSDSVYACIPVGETVFYIPKIEVSAGAKFAVYNDRACTSLYDDDRITGVGIIPTVKYIKVTSEDGNLSKVYSLSVLQAENDQAELTYIDGALRVSESEYAAAIPANESSFSFTAQYSEGAEISVYDGDQELKPYADGIFSVDNISSSKTISIVVKSAKGNEKTFTLKVSKDMSSCEVSSIFGMINKGDDTSVFEAKVRGNSFKVIPYLVNNNASYGVYSDRNCTKQLSGDVVPMVASTTTAYLKVTSADGSSSRIYTLEISTTDSNFKPIVPEVEYYTVENATQTAKGEYYIDAADNLSEYSLKLNLTDDTCGATTYRAFTDAQCTSAVGQEYSINDPTVIKTVAKYTTVYVKVWVKRLETGAEQPTGVSTDIIKVTINSNRPKAVYNDTDKISGWALDQINFLNDNGYGYFQGDNGSFRPRDNITRFEGAALAIRMLGIDETVYSNIILPFTDNIPNWASNYVKACYKLGIMNGIDQTTFDGRRATTRQEFAKIIVGTVVLMRGDATDALTLYNATQAQVDEVYNARGFADEDAISNWAKPYVRLAVSYGIINGSNDYGVLNINPKKSITRQEVAVTLANYNGFKK